MSMSSFVINQQILPNKYGIRGTALELLKSYLSHRLQYVQIHNARSKALDITCGVPQGSTLRREATISFSREN